MAANPFAAAAAKASTPATSKKKKENIIEVKDIGIGEAIREFVLIDAKIKGFEADQKVVKGIVVPKCLGDWIGRYVEDSRMPDTIKFRVPRGLLPNLVNPKSKDREDQDYTVTFIVQDRGEQYQVSDEQMATITALLGPEKTEKVIKRDMTFSFNSVLLNKSGVMEAVGEKLGQLVKDGILTDEEFASLLKAEPRTTVRKGTVADLSRLCENNGDLMKSVLEALGSHSTQYIKV